jgi:leader peptidase (prepilin peptidase) / N-methyltransferase
MVTVVIIGVGLILGSFLSVLIERWHTQAGIIGGRSQCAACGHVLAWYDLFPLISWMVLRGRCRYCRIRISPRYPAMELVMAIALGVYTWQFGIPSLWMLSNLVILFGLVSLFFFDLRWRILPDVFTLGLSAIALARMIGLRSDLLVSAIATGVFLAAGFGVLYLISHGRWLGFGDVKMGLMIGLLFGFPAAVGVTLIAIWAGALVGVVLMIRHRATMETALPFGSFWAAAAILTIIIPGPVAFLSGLVIPFAL